LRRRDNLVGRGAAGFERLRARFGKLRVIAISLNPFVMLFVSIVIDQDSACNLP
jgi:hypothetical protein